MGVYKCYNRLVLLTKAKKGGTMVATVIICIVIAVAAVFAGRRAVRTFSGDGSCCGRKRTKKDSCSCCGGGNAKKASRGKPSE